MKMTKSSVPNENVIDQVETCQDFATNRNDPYLQSKILNLPIKSDCCFEDCEKWMDNHLHRKPGKTLNPTFAR